MSIRNYHFLKISVNQVWLENLDGTNRWTKSTEFNYFTDLQENALVPEWPSLRGVAEKPTLTFSSRPTRRWPCPVRSLPAGWKPRSREHWALNKHGKNQANTKLLKVLEPQEKNPSLKLKKASVKELSKECVSII